MKKSIVIGIVLLLIGAIVVVSGCTSDTSTVSETPVENTESTSEPVDDVETPVENTESTSEPVDDVDTSLGTGATNCPVCSQPGEYSGMQEEYDMYWCEECGIVWGVDYENDCKFASSILDYEDDGQISEDELYIVPL